MSKKFKLKAPKPELPPIYYVFQNLACKCGHMVIQEDRNMEEHYITFFCANQVCDQYQVSKRLDLPCTSDYKLV